MPARRQRLQCLREPPELQSLAAGSHTFQVRATDGAGNVDPSPASFTWNIDLTAPDTTLTEYADQPEQQCCG